MSELTFLKLGGSLLTDKTAVEKPRLDVLTRIAAEIQWALTRKPDLRLVIGHGSGSFGHVAAAKYGTRHGVSGPDQWKGFAEVSAAAARLNGLVREAMLAAGVPVVTFQPSASAVCENGQIVSFATSQIRTVVSEGLVPLIYGDVAIDIQQGGTIISTEEILSYLAYVLDPARLLLAGETDGVLDADGYTIPQIDAPAILQFDKAIGVSRGTDVTGGMAAKVGDMVALSQSQPDLVIRIFSGLVEGAVEKCLLTDEAQFGTLITGTV